MKFHITQALLFLTLIITGCGEPRAPLPHISDVTPYKVKALLNEHHVGIAKVKFLNQFKRLVAEERWLSATVWLRRWPDVATRILRETPITEENQKTMELIASIYDNQLGLDKLDLGWIPLLKFRQDNLEQYTEYSEMRENIRELLRQGRFEQASEVNVPTILSDPPIDLIHIDALRLQGIAFYLNNQFELAEDVFERAAEMCWGRYNHFRVELLTLRFQAQRFQKKDKDARATWLDAVTTAHALLELDPPVVNPKTWKRLHEVKFENQAWPDETIMALLSISEFPQELFLTSKGGFSVDKDSIVLSIVGQWQLKRREYKEALLVFKQASALIKNVYVGEWMRLGQAKALIKLNQSASASAILGSLARKKKSGVFVPASALLGTLELKKYRVRTGLSFLKRALDANTSASWKGKGKTEADLGLGYFMNDDMELGYKWLRIAQKHMTSEGDYEGLLQCLRNEKRFLEYEQKYDESLVVNERIQQIENSTIFHQQ